MPAITCPSRTAFFALWIVLGTLSGKSSDSPVPELNTARANVLKDPAGDPHARLAIADKVGVVIFSVPDMSLGPSQRRWSKLLADEAESRLPEEVGFSLVENMALAGAFRDDARSEMKKQSASKKRPLLLLDETGDTFQRFGILRDQTEILIFDKNGRLRDIESDLDDREQVLARIKAIVAKLL